MFLHLLIMISPSESVCCSESLKFEYSSDIQKDAVCSLKNQIKERLNDSLKAAWQNGQDLVNIRYSLGYGAFNQWLNSREWGYSARWAYSLISVYEKSSENGIAQRINANQLQISPSLFVKLFASYNRQVLSQLKELLEQGEIVTKDTIDGLRPSSKAAIKQLQETGCLSCIHYHISYGRRRCNFFDQTILNLEKQINLDIKNGCESLVCVNQSIIPESNLLELPEIIWTKVTTAASKSGSTPEKYVANFISTGLEKIQLLEAKIQALETENNTLRLQNNTYLTQIRRAS